MATVNDIVTRAFRKIGVSAAGEGLDADYAAEGIDTLNMMLAAWKLAGVDTTFTELGLSDTFPLAYEYQEGTVYMLASRLSPNYEVPQSFDADDFFRKIQAAYLTIDKITLPSALRRMPSQDDAC